MGWLIGFSGPSVPPGLVIQQDGGLYELTEKGLKAQVGGLAETCCCGELESGGKFLVSGIGIHGGRILGEKDWTSFLVIVRLTSVL